MVDYTLVPRMGLFCLCMQCLPLQQLEVLLFGAALHGHTGQISRICPTSVDWAVLELRPHIRSLDSGMFVLHSYICCLLGVTMKMGSDIGTSCLHQVTWNRMLESW